MTIVRARRRHTVAGVSFRVVSVTAGRDGPGWALHRLRDVRAVLADVEGDGLAAREVVLACDRAWLGTEPSARGVSVTATLPAGTLAALLARSGSGWTFDLRDGEPRLRRLPGVDVVVRPEVVDGDLRLVPVAVRGPAGRLPTGGWLPVAVTIRVPLPWGLRLRDVAVGADAVVVRAGLDGPATLPRERIRALVAALGRGRGLSPRAR